MIKKRSPSEPLPSFTRGMGRLLVIVGLLLWVIFRIVLKYLLTPSSWKRLFLKITGFFKAWVILFIYSSPKATPFLKAMFRIFTILVIYLFIKISLTFVKQPSFYSFNDIYEKEGYPVRVVCLKSQEETFHQLATMIRREGSWVMYADRQMKQNFSVGQKGILINHPEIAVQVTSIGEHLDIDYGLFKIMIKIINPEDLGSTPLNAFESIEVTVKTLPSAIVVDEGLLHRDIYGQNPEVWILKGTELKSQGVTIGTHDAERSQLTSGVSEGDCLISGQTAIRYKKLLNVTESESATDETTKAPEKLSVSLKNGGKL